MNNALLIFIAGCAAAIVGFRVVNDVYIALSGILLMTAGINYWFLLLKKREAEEYYSRLESITPEEPTEKSAA